MEPETNSTCLYSIIDVEEGVVAVTVVTGLLSLGGSIAIFASYIRLAAIRNTPRRLLCCLTVADAVTALMNIAGTLMYWRKYEREYAPTKCPRVNSGAACKVLSAITTYAVDASYMWTMAISVYFYISIMKHLTRDSKPLVALIIVVCLGLPGIITATAISANVLGDSMSLATGPWCWIDGTLPNAEQVKWLIVTGLGWEGITYFVTVSLYMILTYRVWLRSRRGGDWMLDPPLRQADKNYLWVPLVLIGTRLWGTIREIMACVRLTHRVYIPVAVDDVFIYLQCIGNSGQALFNSILFCVCDRDVRQWIFHKCCKSQPNNVEENDMQHVIQDKERAKLLSKRNYDKTFKFEVL